MMQKLSSIVAEEGAEMLSFISYEYGLGATKTHTYYKLELGIKSANGQHFLKTGLFTYDVPLGGSTKALVSALRERIQAFKK